MGAKLIESVRNRAEELNADEWMPLLVEEIRIFGSWVTGSHDLGDIDLAVDFQRRYGIEYHIELTEILVERDGYEGSFFDRLCYDGGTHRYRCRKPANIQGRRNFSRKPAAMTDIQHN